MIITWQRKSSIQQKASTSVMVCQERFCIIFYLTWNLSREKKNQRKTERGIKYSRWEHGQRKDENFVHLKKYWMMSGPVRVPSPRRGVQKLSSLHQEVNGWLSHSHTSWACFIPSPYSLIIWPLSVLIHLDQCLASTSGSLSEHPGWLLLTSPSVWLLSSSTPFVPLLMLKSHC